jgi:hypothetical protein
MLGTPVNSCNGESVALRSANVYSGFCDISKTSALFDNVVWPSDLTSVGPDYQDELLQYHGISSYIKAIRDLQTAPIDNKLKLQAEGVRSLFLR